MQALTCNICGRLLKGEAYELTTLRGAPVPAFDGGTMISNREAARQLQLCSACGSWVKLGLQTVRESYAAAEALKSDPRWLRSG